MVDPIDVLKSDCAEAFDENDRLRTINAELMTIIDAIIRATAQCVRARLITDPADADRLNVRVGDHVVERDAIKCEPPDFMGG